MLSVVKKTILAVAILMLVAPGVAQASRAVHYLNCSDCHRSGLSLYSLTGGLCLSCHGSASPPVTLNDNTSASPVGKFEGLDASNAMGSHPSYNAATAQETSHMWAVMSETNPAAGAQSPTTYKAQFDGRYGISRGKLICNRCHNPHGTDTYDTKLLKLDNSRDQMCRDCHLPWTTSEPNAFESHPLVADYDSVADPAKFNTLYNAATGLLDTNVGQGEVRLLYNSVSGKYMVSCTSCHGVHFTDSDAATVDGKTNYNSLTVGDGKLLRSDGYRDPGGLSTSQLAQKRSNLCQACHTYQLHGKAGGEEIGCLDCHSGHSYNGGNPNYFVLRGQTTTTTFNSVTGLSYNALTVADGGGKNVWEVWADNNAGTAGGYCEKCHGNLPTMPLSIRSHSEGEDCRTCHAHDKAGTTRSFEATGCDGCHGYPPRTLNQGGPDGYAYDSGNGYDYSAQTFYKQETATPHKAHAGGSGDYTFPCANCHANNNHDTGTFQDVFIAPYATLASGGGSLSPAYSGDATGTCSNVYCHSNGGARTGDASRNYVAASIPDWKDGSTTGAITTCDACHGNTAGTMTTKSNSTTHQVHLAGPQGKTFTCNVCHVNTASNATTLAAGAIGTTHVNNTHDVAFDTSYNLGGGLLTYNSAIYATGYESAGGNCSVYCHSDGNGNVATIPDWDAVATGNCTVCHNHDTSDTPMATGSHAAHINDSGDGTVEVGWNLGCVECHANTVSGNNTISNAGNHVDGAETLGISRDGNKTTCTNISCHSNGNFDDTVTYVNPTWGNSLGCDGCHGGGGAAYPNYANGGTGSNANSHAAHIAKGYTCNECHSQTSTNGTAIDGTAPTNHVNQAVDVVGAQIGSYTGASNTCNNVACHGGGSPQWGDTNLSCSQCHMGTSPDTDNFTYNDGTTAAINDAEWTYSGHGMGSVGLAGANVCLYCHDDTVGHGAANYFRLRTNATQGFTDLNGACLGCHGTTGSGVDPDGAAGGYASKTASLKIDKYHAGAKHVSDMGGQWCWDCHDPHGDASAADPNRIKMIQRNAASNSDVNGVPVGGLTTTDIVFTDNTIGAGAGGFARDITGAAAAEGVCNNCHTTTAQYTQATGKGTHGTGKCTTCHKHSEDTAYDQYAFKGSGCNGCHGDNDGVGAGVQGQFWPDGEPASPAYADNQAGAHAAHVLAIGQELGYGDYNVSMYSDADQQTICAFCHPNPGAAGHDTDVNVTGSDASRVDVFLDGDDGAGNTDVFRKWGPLTNDYASDVDGSVGNQAYSYVSSNCSNLACHNRTSTPADWNTPAAGSDCSVCHGGSGSASGRHDTHVTGKGYACTECHVDNGVFPTATSGLAHADGAVNLVWTNAGSFQDTYNVATLNYNGGLIYADGSFGTCSNAACHWNVNTPAFDAAPVGAPNCAVCHGTPASGKHVEHVANTTYVSGSCVECHGTNADTGTHGGHVNGSLDEVVTYVPGTQTCTNTCHIADTTGDWTVGGSLACADCHDADNVGAQPDGYYSLDQNAYPPVSAKHTAHLANNVYVPNDCADCHGAGADTGVHGSHKNGSVDNTLSYASATQTCTNSCHTADTVGDWTAGGALLCTDCHTSGLIGTAPGTGLHATGNVLAHDDNFDAGYTCTDCHASGGPSADHKTGVLQDSTQTSYTFNPANIASYTQAGGCAANCHGDAAANGGTGKWSRKWIGVTDAPLTGNPGDAVCDNCHNDGLNSGTGLPDDTWNGGVSPVHGTDFDGDATANEVLSPLSNHGTCQSCHGWGSGNYTIGTMHRDGTLQMNGPDVTPGPATGAEYDDVNHGCLAACHTGSFANGSGDPNENHTLADSGWTVGYGDFGSGDCDTCHASNGRDHTGATTENSGLHATHVASGYVTNCTACHPHDGISVPPGTGVHNVGDNTVNFGGTYMGTSNNYTGADFGGTCAAANGCHDSSAGDWKAGTLTNTCADCHAATGKLLDQGAYPPTSAKHTKHIDNNAYVTGDCADCHGAGAATGAHAGHKQNNGIDNVVSYASATQTCTIACHAVTTGDWTAGGSVVCADCHTGTYVGPNPSSGLHATTNVMAHDGNFDAGYDCYSCHQATPSTTHIQGGAAQDSTQTTYNFNAGNIFSYTQAGGCAANCHADASVNGGTGKWSRKWIGVTDALLTGANPGDAVCDNCHNDGINSGTGLPDDTWNGGVSPAHGTDFDGDATANEVLSPLSNHSTCQACHGWGNGNYAIGTMHRDGTLQMNGPDATPGPASGAQYDDVNHGCLAACHTGSLTNPVDPNFNHALVDSGWTIGYGDYGSGDCDTCHASNGRTHANVTTESADTHGLHTTSEYITACTQCHPHDGLSVSPGTGIHADGTVNFNNTLMPNTYDYTGADFGGGTFGNCSTNTCHDTDDGANEWNAVSLGGDSCTDCHDSGKAGIFTVVSLSGSTPTSDKHGLHLANTNVISDCSECHGVGYGALSSVSPFTNHITTTVEIGDQLTAYTAPDCTTNCHDMNGADEVAISGDEPSWPTADTDTLGCADCHGKAGNTLSAPVHAGLSNTSGPATGKHSQHVGADPDYVGASPCITCHTHEGALAGGSNGHVNGVNATLDASITWTSPTCTNACHVTAAGRDWTTGTLNCTDCHTTAKTLGAGGDAGMNGTTAPNSGRHSAHMSNASFVGGGCTDCHGHNGVLSDGANGHVNGPAKTNITVASQLGSYDAASTQTCVNSCHTVVDGRDWTAGAPSNGTVLACADCHAASGKSLDQGAFPPVSNKHGQHLGSNALPATDQNECYACHDGTVDNTGTLKIANHANLSAAVAFNGGFNYEGAAASKAGSGTTTTCSNIKCHAGTTTPTWDAASAVGCSSCHNTGGTGPLPSGTTAGSHAKHANNDAVYTDCANCHGNAASYTATGGHADHQNLSVNVAFSASVDPGADNLYTDGDGAAGVNYGGDFTDDGTCSSVDCHFNSTTPAWGTAGGTTCTSCHNDGVDSGLLTDAAPATGRHDLHVTTADSDYVNDCESCHGAGANTGAQSGHSQLNGPDFDASLTWTSPTCTNACHTTAAGRDWTTGNLVCTDCHSSTKSLDAGGAADLTSTTPPHDNKHDEHMADTIYVSGGCTDCHGHSGALGNSVTTGHVDGPAVTSITVASQVGSYDAATTQTCVNTCHSVVDGRDWTSAETAGLDLDCVDCHDASGKTLYRDRTSGSHSAHVFTATPPTASDYGRIGNTDSANYDFGCGECHPAAMATSHLNGSSREIIAGVNYTGGAAGTCSQNNCHQSGTGGAPASVPTWGTAFTGDICAKCHGNSPGSGSHSAHVVGIHYDTIYSGTTGLATAGNLNTSAHGNAATATTINCNVCHSSTVASAANAANTVCAGCHSDTGSPATGNGAASIADKTVHVNGAANVAFAPVNVKSKAQIRDDITTVPELNSTWTRDPVGYKAGGAFDGANAALTTGVYNSTFSSCSTVACHNGYGATWGDATVSCDSCHKELP